MKYLYNPLNKHEYFFIIKDNEDIEIYLIKNENTFKLIKKLNYINDEEINIINDSNNNNISDLDDSYSQGGGTMLTSFNLLDVISNENDKNVYIIINYLIMKNAGSESLLDYYISKTNNMFKFKDDKLNLIKTFKFVIDFNLNCLIYINNDCVKKYLLDSYQRDNLII